VFDVFLFSEEDGLEGSQYAFPSVEQLCKKRTGYQQLCNPVQRVINKRREGGGHNVRETEGPGLFRYQVHKYLHAVYQLGFH